MSGCLDLSIIDANGTRGCRQLSVEETRCWHCLQSLLRGSRSRDSDRGSCFLSSGFLFVCYNFGGRGGGAWCRAEKKIYCPHHANVVQIHKYKADTGEPLATHTDFTDSDITAMDLDPTHRFLLLGTADGDILVITVHPSGAHLLTSTLDRNVSPCSLVILLVCVQVMNFSSGHLMKVIPRCLEDEVIFLRAYQRPVKIEEGDGALLPPIMSPLHRPPIL